MISHSSQAAFTFLPVVVGFLFSTADPAAQESKPQRTPGALTMASSLGLRAAFPVIQNRPYIATVRTQSIEMSESGVRVLHEALNIRMRDFAGRIRDEQLASEPDAQGAFAQGSVQILDPISMRDTRWNEETKIVVVSNIDASLNHAQDRLALECSERMSTGNDPYPNGDPVHDQVRYENLGRREVDGLDAVGCRITQTFARRSEAVWFGTTVTEIWDSQELQINLLTTTKESDGREQITTTSDLRKVEPDPILFQVPAGFTDPMKPTKPSR